MKYSDEFISYLGYRTLWWNAMSERDYEKSRVYMDEMFSILDRLNTAELLEAVKQSNIMGTIYSDRSC